MEKSNILKALLNIETECEIDLMPMYSGANRINNIGVALEEYIKDIFAGTLRAAASRKTRLFSEVFSYMGNSNNPPDIMLRMGDAIEVKKLETRGSHIALNSSYPKNKLHSDDSRILDACRTSENWEEKDIIYVIGYLKDRKLKHIWFVYGDCYAASQKIYTRIADAISGGIIDISDIEFAETNELGRVNRVDPLGITYLRIRGMWHIENPFSVYQDVYRFNQDNEKSGFACIMRKEKFESFPQEDIDLIKNKDNIEISEKKIKNPDNPAQLIDAILIHSKEEK